MCSQPFQARIASIIPTTYNPAAHGANDPPLQQPDEFQKAIDQIMGTMAAEWDDVSRSSIEIAHRSKQVKTEVKRLTKEGRIK